MIPQLSADQGFNLTWSPDMTSAYHADLHEAEPKDRELFTLLEELVKAQEQSQVIVRHSISININRAVSVRSLIYLNYGTVKKQNPLFQFLYTMWKEMKRLVNIVKNR